MITFVAGLILFQLSGCDRTRPSLFEERQSIGTSVEGIPIECLTLGKGKDSTLIIATIHGNEFAGTSLVHRLADEYRAHPQYLDGRELLIVPIANPDGYFFDERTNSRGIDLNRNFPATNREANRYYGNAALTEPESQALFQLLKDRKPNRIVSIHQPLTTIDYDGPAEEIARQMARYCNLKVERVGSRPGSLGSYAGVDMGIPIITLELRRWDQTLSREALWKAYGKALAEVVSFPDPPLSVGPTFLRLVPQIAAILLLGGSIIIIIARALRASRRNSSRRERK